MPEGQPFIYWEQDSDFQFTRMACLHGSMEQAPGQIGHHWSEGALPLTLQDWEMHRALLARREPFDDFVYARTAPVGQTRFFRLSGAPVFDEAGQFAGYRGLATDASQLIEQRRQIALAKQTLLAFDIPVLWVESAGDRNQHLRIVFANLRACKLFERTDSELCAIDPKVLFEHGEQPVAQIASLLNSGGNSELSLRLQPKFGKPIAATARIDASVDVNVAPGLARRAILILSLPGEAAPEISATAGGSERLSAELESFSYTVSHDLRAPLRLVDGFARILQEDYGQALDRIGRDHLQRILLAASRMNHMIDALLELSRLSTQPLVRQPVDLSQMAQAVLDELARAEPARQVRQSIQPGLTVWGDPTMLRIAMTNLLSNAWKYSGKNPQASISFGIVEQEGESAFCVDDNGVGFDMRFAERLFSPFQRLHGSADFPGTGVGLATVKRIVSRHGGRIWVVSGVGEGSRFFFTLGQRASRREPRPGAVDGAIGGAVGGAIGGAIDGARGRNGIAAGASGPVTATGLALD